MEDLPTNSVFVLDYESVCIKRAKGAHDSQICKANMQILRDAFPLHLFCNIWTQKISATNASINRACIRSTFLQCALTKKASLANMKQNIVQSQRYSNENLRNMEICGQLVMNTLPQGVHLNSRMRKKHKSLTLWAWLGQYHIHSTI